MHSAFLNRIARMVVKYYFYLTLNLFFLYYVYHIQIQHNILINGSVLRTFFMVRFIFYKGYAATQLLFNQRYVWNITILSEAPNHFMLN